jgi:SAM-dependent methyltransferase
MKKYALKNSYFKSRYGDMPDTILEIAKYYKEKGELPFKYEGSNWVYDAFCERQKRRGVYYSQYLTPDATVERMVHFADYYFIGKNVIEPCCGTGQITKKLIDSGYNVAAFDTDAELIELCKMLYPNAAVTFTKSDFRNLTDKGVWNIIANPPYETAELTDFLEWISTVQDEYGTSILLLPKGFISKTNPRIFDVMKKFGVLATEDMLENFERTGTKAEIVVLRKEELPF